MIHYLLLFQFALIYTVIVVLGLVNYGSDFASITGKLYLLPLIVVPVLHHFRAQLVEKLSSPWVAAMVLLTGAVLSFLAYQPLHFGYWDEHNLRQAILLAVLGIFSYLSASIAVIRLQDWRGNHLRAATGAWLVLGLLWLIATAYPMVPLLGLAMILAVAVIWQVSDKPEQEKTSSLTKPPAGLPKYLFFLLALDLGLMLWDYQVDSRWGWYMGGALIAAGMGYWRALTTGMRLYWPVMVVVCVNYVAAILWPAFVIHPLHSVPIGITMGWVVGHMMQREEMDCQPMVMLVLAWPLFLGLVTGYLFYANLAYVDWRVLLLVPLMAILMRKHLVPAKAEIS